MVGADVGDDEAAPVPAAAKPDVSGKIRAPNLSAGLSYRARTWMIDKIEMFAVKGDACQLVGGKLQLCAGESLPDEKSAAKGQD